jgi:hypothetical protein
MLRFAMSKIITQDAVQTEKPMSDAEIAARNKRIAVLKRIAGIWADREDIPADSVDYHRQLRLHQSR